MNYKKAVIIGIVGMGLIGCDGMTPAQKEQYRKVEVQRNTIVVGIPVNQDEIVLCAVTALGGISCDWQGMHLVYDKQADATLMESIIHDLTRP